MGMFLPVLILIGIVIYVIELIMNPEKHKVALIILAIFSGISDGNKKSNRRK